MKERSNVPLENPPEAKENNHKTEAINYDINNEFSVNFLEH
jgi:hypothetical protein